MKSKISGKSENSKLGMARAVAEGHPRAHREVVFGHGRLAMIAIAGMMAQEAVSGSKFFF